MKNNTFGMAIIGYGGMGGWHAETMARIEEINLTGVFDTDPARRQAATAGQIYAYNSLEALLADPAVQAVTIATPNDTHLHLALAAMQAGKHVVCEKPVALNSAQLAKMADCAKRCGVLFTVHQNRRWDEDYLVAKHLVAQNTLGPVFRIESRVHGSRGIPGDWRNQPQHGGGMVLDWGVHLIDQMLQMMEGRALLSVWARLSHVTNEQVDDGFYAEFTFAGGLSYYIEVGTSNFISLPRWYIQGCNGTAVVQDWDCSGEVVMVSDWEKRDAVPVVTAAGLTKTMAPRTDATIQRYPLPSFSSDIRGFYRNLMQAAQGQAPLLVTPAQAGEVMAVMEAVFKAAHTGQTLHFNPKQPAAQIS